MKVKPTLEMNIVKAFTNELIVSSVMEDSCLLNWVCRKNPLNVQIIADELMHVSVCQG